MLALRDERGNEGNTLTRHLEELNYFDYVCLAMPGGNEVDVD
jgi:hypothetical protein